ncbi:hypothetical protein F5877DRAFT_81384 [Lentinula edodes]|nr:hypothetical protein F5877DRAFT_81384 [Lentinula edodes]
MSQCVEQLSGGGENNVYNELVDYYWTGSNFLTFKDIFQSKGYELWNNTGLARDFVPPNANPRAPDGFSYDDPSGAAGKPYFSAAVEKHWPARTPDNQDVLLVLIKDPVELAILRDVAMGTKGGIDRNHVLPLLRIIEHEKLTFGVFPLIGMSLLHPWFANLNQMLDAIYQILEGVVFFHDNFIAHRTLNSQSNSVNWDPTTRAVIGRQVGRFLYQLVKPAQSIIAEIVCLLETMMEDNPSRKLSRPSDECTLR